MRFFYLSAMLFFTVVLHAQITFLPGYYINTSGFKKECFIKSSVSGNSKELYYKLTEDADENVLKLNDVSEFGIYGRHTFKKFNLAIDNATSDLTSLRTSATPKWENQIVFLKLIVDGKIALFETESRNNKFFYLKEGMEKPVQLLHIEYTDPNDVKIIRYDFTFRNQLYELMADKGYPLDRFKNLDYRKKTLVKLFLDYNGIEPGKQASDQDDSGKLSIKIVPGIGQSSVEIGKMFKENWGHKESGILSYRIGAEFEYYPGSLNNKWSLFTDPNYQVSDSEFEYREAYLSQNPRFIWKTSYKVLELPIGIRHHMYFNKSTKAFISLAYNFYSGSSSNVVYQRRELYTTANDIDQKMALKFKSRVSLGGGVSYKKFSFEARAALGSAEFGQVDLSEQAITYRSKSVEGKISSVFFILGYKLM